MKDCTETFEPTSKSVLAVQKRRKTLSIDDILAWAYRQELPKSAKGLRSSLGSSSSASMWESLAVLGVRVDVMNAYGCIPTGFDDGEPDPDAVIVAEHVAALAHERVSPVEGIDLLTDPACSILEPHEREWAHARGFRMAVDEQGRLRSSLAAGVISAAHLNKFRAAPAIEALKRRDVRIRGTIAWFRMIDGVEVFGFDHKRRRPYPGAYRKTELDTDLASFVCERIEYQAWRQALDLLAMRLKGELDRFDPAPSLAPWCPWMGKSAAKGPRILQPLRISEK